jgi:hypothetical protein
VLATITEGSTQLVEASSKELATRQVLMAEEGDDDALIPIGALDGISEDEHTADAVDENDAERNVRRARNRARAVRRRWANERIRSAQRELDAEFAAADERGFRTPVANIARVTALLERSNDPNVQQALRYAQRAWIQLDQQAPASLVGDERVGDSRSQAPSRPTGDRPRPQRSNNNDGAGGSQVTGGRRQPPPANNPRQHNRPRQQLDLRQKINEGRDVRSVLNSRRREREVAERDDADCSDCFPAFTMRFNSYKYPEGFKPIGITKYDGKQAPQQWLRCYSTAIEVAGGSNTTKVIYFLMALEPAPLTWLESLPNDSIDSWEGLKKVFNDNFQGAITRAGTRHDLAQCKQERNELLRSYTRRFFDVRATIANITEEDIIDCFYNDLTDPGIYRDFGCNRPKSVAGLRDMMHDWSEQEEKMRERFPRCTDLNQKRNNDNRADKGQRDFSGSSQKRKPEDLVAAVERPSRGKKSTAQEQFEKLLQKKCPWCVNSKHAAIDCFQLNRTFGSPRNGKKNKSTGKDPEDEDQEDKSETAKFQDASKTVNVIFGGDEDFCSKREQKLLLPGNSIHRAGGTTTTLMVGGPHIIFPY